MRGIVYDLLKPTSIDGHTSALVEMRDMEEPDLPGKNWIKIKPFYAGVCGSDMGLIFYKNSPVLAPFSALSSILGHEVSGVVTEVGKDVKKVKLGQRVTVDPYFSCEVRGRDHYCPSCREGKPSLCRYAGGTDTLGPGMLLGFCEDIPGAWSESIVVHESMTILVPDTISDKTAALIEPLSVGLHAVLRQLPEQGERILIIGGGIISYAVIAAIRLLELDCHITHLSLLEYQKEMALTLGADEAWTSREELESAVAKLPETIKHKPIMAKRNVYSGGYDTIYDCIGSKESLDDSLRLARSRGNISLVGCAGEIKHLDMTFVWANELSIAGTHAYSQKETWQGREMSTQEILIELLEQKKSYPLESLITHEYSLDQYKEALATNLNREKYQSIKTLFRI